MDERSPVRSRQVIATDPSPCCVVAPNTVVFCAQSPVQREDEEECVNGFGYDDLAGECFDFARRVRLGIFSVSHSRRARFVPWMSGALTFRR